MRICDRCQKLTRHPFCPVCGAPTTPIRIIDAPESSACLYCTPLPEPHQGEVLPGAPADGAAQGNGYPPDLD